MSKTEIAVTAFLCFSILALGSGLIAMESELRHYKEYSEVLEDKVAVCEAARFLVSR